MNPAGLTSLILRTAYHFIDIVLWITFYQYLCYCNRSLSKCLFDFSIFSCVNLFSMRANTIYSVSFYVLFVHTAYIQALNPFISYFTAILKKNCSYI